MKFLVDPPATSEIVKASLEVDEEGDLLLKLNNYLILYIKGDGKLYLVKGANQVQGLHHDLDCFIKVVKVGL